MASRKMNKKRLLKSVIQITIYAVVGYFIYTKLDGDIQNLLNYEIYSYNYLILAVLIFTLHSVINAFSWHRMMILTGQSVGLGGQFDVYLRSFLLRYIPGNVVGIFARGIFNKKYGVGHAHSLWGWFFENIVYLMWGLLLGSYVIFKNLAQFLPLLDFDDRSQLVLVAGLGFLILFAVGTALVSLFKLDILEGIFRRFLLPPLKKRVKGVKYTKFEIGELGRLEMFIRYGLAWLIPSLTFLVVVYAITGNTLERPLELISASALAWSIGYIAVVTPSGGGVREFVLIYLLSTVSGYSAADSVIIAIGSRVITILGELLTLGIFYPIFWRKKTKNEKQS